MATQRFNATSAATRFTPISSQLGDLTNGAGTIATLVRKDNAATGGDMAGVVDTVPVTDWFHALEVLGTTSELNDDTGPNNVHSPSPLMTGGATADDFVICGVDWPSGTSVFERFHISAKMGSAESWTHENSASANKPADRAGPGTGGSLAIGFTGDSHWVGDIALVGIWKGIRFTDTDWTNLWISKQTSDWWNHPAGNPTALVECTSLTPTDIGANASTFSTTGAALTGLDPTGWTFDGRGTPAAGINVAWITA